MSDHLRKSIDELIQKLRQQESDITETKKAINILSKMLGEPEPYSIGGPNESVGTIRPDTFFGKGLATAVGEYLEMIGHACPVADIMSGLRRGGYNWEGAKYPERVLRISLSKNTSKFVQIKGSDSFGLREWYPDLKSEKRSPKSNGKDDEVTTPEETSEPDYPIDDSSLEADSIDDVPLT